MHFLVLVYGAIIFSICAAPTVPTYAELPSEALHASMLISTASHAHAERSGSRLSPFQLY